MDYKDTKAAISTITYNKQIEVSKFYERLPKPTAIAVEEWLNGKVYHRTPEEE